MNLNIQPWCTTKVDEDGFYVPGFLAYCSKNCPVVLNDYGLTDYTDYTLKVIPVNPDDDTHVSLWSTDNTLKLIHHSDLKDTIIALKLLGIMSFSILLIALMVKVLGISVIWFCKYEK